MAAPRRTHLGTQTALSHVRRVYRTADAIEVDEIEGTDVTRRRVLLDEVPRHLPLCLRWLAFVLTMIALVTTFGFLSGSSCSLTAGRPRVFALPSPPRSRPSSSASASASTW
jgi:hypothetical protein